MIKSYFFIGKVHHSRNIPKKHTFTYKYKSIYNENIYNFQNDKFNDLNLALSKYDNESDIVEKKIIGWFNDFIIQKNIDKEQVSIDLLKTPNILLRNSFNPVCFWFLKSGNKIVSYIAEVSNTFKEKQIYHIENNGKFISDTEWLEVEKKMYVSPFADKIGKYKFNLLFNPLTIKINEFNPNKELEIITCLSGKKVKVSKINYILFIISLYVNSLTVIPKIHIQAFFLWRKKIKFFNHKGDGYVK